MTLDIDRLRELLTTARNLENPVASMKAWEELDQGSMLMHALTLLDALAARDAEIARLRDALQDIADGMGEDGPVQIKRYAPAIARAALEDTP